MVQQYHDVKAICRGTRPPDLFFFIINCNPNWKEVIYMVGRILDQRVEDRPDFIARVLRMRLKELIDD